MTVPSEKERFLEERLTGIEEISRTLASTLDIDELLPRLMERISGIVSCERSTLYLLDPEKQELWSKVFEGEEAVTIRLPVGKGIAGEVARSGRSMNVDDAYAHPLFLPDIDKLTGFRTRSLLNVPLRNSHGELTGVVQVLNRRDGNPFDDGDQALLEALSSQISLALRTSWLYTSLVRHNRELDVINEIEREVSRLKDPEEVLDRVLTKAIEALGCEAGSILLKSESDRGKLYFRTAIGEKGRSLKGYTIDLGQGIVGWVAEHGKVARVNDVAADKRHDPTLSEKIDFPARQVLSVPLCSAGEVVGAVELINRVGRAPFSEESERFLTFIGIQIVKALREAREACVREQSERLATIGRMLAGVIHDLRTPMTVITGCADYLKTENDTEKRQILSDRILNQLNVLRKMTEDLMAFARGESSIFVRKVYLHQFLDELEELVQVEVTGTSIEAVWQREYEGAALFDADSIRRARLNLARNAIEAMKQDGKLTFKVAEGGGRLFISVTDTGQGIPEEIRGTLFEAFVTKGKEHGTGLGLALVRQAVHDHGGAIDVSTSSGKGTTFTISLPMKQPDC